MKYLDSLHSFMGIEVTSSPTGYLLSQSKYIVGIFDHTLLSNNKVVDTLIETSSQYTPNSFPFLDPNLYHIIVGSLVYLTITYLNISYDVHFVSQSMASPIPIHWEAILNILRYLQRTQFHSLLLLYASSLELCAYCDVDWRY